MINLKTALLITCGVFCFSNSYAKDLSESYQDFKINLNNPVKNLDCDWFGSLIIIFLL